MVSTSPNKKEDAVAVAATTTTNQLVTKSTVGLVPGPKPLSKHRFYLDVKNHLTYRKLQTKIKELGGLLELFLIKEVTHVVTDKEEWPTTGNKGGGITPKTPQTPGNSSSVQNDHGSNERTPNRGRPKTRADAMLERARKTPTVATKDPLEEARNWGIAIWTVEKAFIWLDKVALSLTKKKRKAKVLELKAPYVKFEAFDRKHRPVFKEIRNWPSFNLHGSAGSSGLVHRSATEKGDQNMTRKSRNNQPQTTTADVAAQSGYCEVCRIEYPRLDQHLESKKHLAFVKDNANFLELDKLINDGTNIESFLKLNGTKEDKCNGVESSPIKMPRTRNSSICERVKSTPLSPPRTETGSGRSRGTKRNSHVSNNYIYDEDDDDDDYPVRETRSSHRTAILKIAEQQSETWSSGRPKRTCIRQKRISIDNNVISENRGYYKVEVKTRPRRETEIFKTRNSNLSEIEDDEEDDDDDDEEEEEGEDEDDDGVDVEDDDKSLIVKFHRMRSSELKRLNNEAENFLFPKRDESSSEEDIDGDGPDTTASTAKFDSTLLSSSDMDEDEKSIDSSISSVCSIGKKKKRLTHAEAFIMDNKKYYKFEMPGSRLRYQGTFMNDVQPVKVPRNNGEMPAVTKEIKDEINICEDDGNFNLEDLKFSFERVPKSEPWYQTFSRQDQGEEYYTCFSDSGCWKPFLMPYEMDRIPPLDPKICFNTYTQIKNQILNELSSGSNSASCSTPDPNYTPELDEDDSKGSYESSEQSEKNLETGVPRRRKRREAGSSVPCKNPRKSPRQHASTLAILSSLIQQRKKRELNRSKAVENKLEAIPEVDLPDELSEYDKQAKTIDDMLTGAFSEFRNLEDIDINVKDNLLNLKYKSNAIEILEDYENFKHVEKKTGLACLQRKCFSPGKKPGRKKKKNRTGWPNKNNRRIKKEILLEDGIDDSTIDSLSVNADSDMGEDSNLTDINISNLGVTKLNTFGDQIKEIVNKNDQSKTDPSVVNKNNLINSEINVQNSEDRVKRETDEVKSDRVVDLDRWENAEKVLAAKISNDVNKDLQFQPYVRVLKLDDDNFKMAINRSLRSSSSPHRTVKKPRRMPASPKSPRVLRKPRGRWYRER